MLKLGYARKPHPIVYADDEPEITPLADHSVEPPLVTGPVQPSPIPILPGTSSALVDQGFDLMKQFLETSLSTGTITEYQVIDLLALNYKS